MKNNDLTFFFAKLFCYSTCQSPLVISPAFCMASLLTSLATLMSFKKSVRSFSGLKQLDVDFSSLHTSCDIRLISSQPFPILPSTRSSNSMSITLCSVTRHLNCWSAYGQWQHAQRPGKHRNGHEVPGVPKKLPHKAPEAPKSLQNGSWDALGALLGSPWPLGRVLGSLGALKSLQASFMIDFRPTWCHLRPRGQFRTPQGSILDALGVIFGRP